MDSFVTLRDLLERNDRALSLDPAFRRRIDETIAIGLRAQRVFGSAANTAAHSQVAAKALANGEAFSNIGRLVSQSLARPEAFTTTTHHIGAIVSASLSFQRMADSMVQVLDVAPPLTTTTPPTADALISVAETAATELLADQDDLSEITALDDDVIDVVTEAAESLSESVGLNHGASSDLRFAASLVVSYIQRAWPAFYQGTGIAYFVLTGYAPDTTPREQVELSAELGLMCALVVLLVTVLPRSED